MQMQITVLSAGTWGISLAALLRGKGYAVNVWEFDPRVVKVLSETRSHPKLPGFELPDGLSLSSDVAAALADATAIVCAVPAAHFRETCARVAAVGYEHQLFVICTKGIEQGSLRLMHEVAVETLGEVARSHLAVLSGPSHAEEVSRGLPTAVTAAAEELETAQQVQQLFMTPRFRLYSQTDVCGVELGGALKNVIAIACGISDGLGYGDNAKAGLITRGLSEILRLGMQLGAKLETFYGLAGMGDLVVTCMSRHSRNWRFGNLIGQGQSVAEALDSVGMVVEGQYTVQAAVELARQNEVEMPITEAVSDVLFHDLKPLEAVNGLMLRPMKSEMRR